MRILVAHNVDRRRRGGMSRIMELIHDHVAAQGHTVEWLSAEDVPTSWGAARRRLGFPWLVWNRARQAARAGRPYDLVNVHEPQALPVTLWQRQLTRIGVVVTSHGLEQRAWQVAADERRRGRGGVRGRSRLLYPMTSLWQSRLALQRAHFILTLNEEDRTYLMEQLRVPASRIGRMRPGAADVFASVAPQRTYDSANHLLFSGTWRENKGTTDLVAAFSSLAPHNSALTLTVLGAGVDPAVVRAAFPDAVGDRVTAIASADDAQIVDALSKADIFVLPSIFEGTPLTLIEAMASGLPVVTTETCGMRDVVEHGRTGLFVPLRSPAAIAAAVEQLCGSKSLRETLGRNAHAYARQHHRWTTVAQEVLECYEALERSATLEPRLVSAS